MKETLSDNLNLDALVYDLVKGALQIGGLNNAGVYNGVRSAIGKEVPIKSIDYTLSWLRHEGMVRPDSDKWVHVEFSPVVED